MDIAIRRQVLGALFIGFCASIAMAQTSSVTSELARKLQGTIFTLPLNQYREGTVEGCGFEFRALTYDSAYKRGEPIILAGSFSLRKIDPKDLFITYKLGTFNFVGDKQVPETPNFAWIKLGNTLVKPDKFVDAESEGFRLYISTLTEQTAKGLESLVMQRQVTVGFNRKDGGMDVVMPLDLGVRNTEFVGDKAVRTRDEKLGTEFASCLSELVEDIK